MLCTGEHVLDAIPAEPGVDERGVLPLLLLPPPPPPLIQASQAGGEDRQVDDIKKYLFEKILNLCQTLFLEYFRVRSTRSNFFMKNSSYFGEKKFSWRTLQLFFRTFKYWRRRREATVKDGASLSPMLSKI